MYSLQNRFKVHSDDASCGPAGSRTLCNACGLKWASKTWKFLGVPLI
ncbi:hypothetical protein NC652_037741 [Populus alba x Populus x berolinensis]|nr:hypothetical protein NC651_036490 [Populus alba x Populus x berolinensis]KAJ6866270.1 hypothetical protein NC652_037741 [Populus alba x Populus x berolinensis]